MSGLLGIAEVSSLQYNYYGFHHYPATAACSCLDISRTILYNFLLDLILTDSWNINYILLLKAK